MGGYYVVPLEKKTSTKVQHNDDWEALPLLKRHLKEKEIEPKDQHIQRDGRPQGCLPLDGRWSITCSIQSKKIRGFRQDRKGDFLYLDFYFFFPVASIDQHHLSTQWIDNPGQKALKEMHSVIKRACSVWLTRFKSLHNEARLSESSQTSRKSVLGDGKVVCRDCIINAPLRRITSTEETFWERECGFERNEVASALPRMARGSAPAAVDKHFQDYFVIQAIPCICLLPSQLGATCSHCLTWHQRQALK